MDTCAACSGPSGPHAVTIQTTEFLDSSLLTGKERYRVRTLELPGLCSGCAGRLNGRRLAADLVCLVPLVGLFVVGVILDAKPLMFAVLAYLIYLARHLDYNWADRLIYGNELLARLAAHIPPGDPGSVMLPVSWTHMFVRIGALPVGLVALALFGKALLSVLPARSATAAPSAQASIAYPKDRIEHARMFLGSARDIQVPVRGAGDARLVLESFPMGGKPFMRLLVHADGTAAPTGHTYQRMSGRQLVDSFLGNSSANLLWVLGAGDPLMLYKFELQRLAAELRAPR